MIGIDPKATFDLRPRKLIIGIAFVLAASVVLADTQGPFSGTQGPFMMTVTDIRELRPGLKWNPRTDDILVHVRGYLRDSIDMYLYATKEQAQLADFSYVLVSDEGEGELRRRCSEGFVELVAKLGWTHGQPILIPIEANKLTLLERGGPEKETCWKAE